MRKENFNGICPDCNSELHEGQHRFADGLYYVISCKNCGFKKETPMEDHNKIKHLRKK
ncbi:hypothetical protein HOD61_02275 [archaeon]|jgi:RNase P subunit RPR2|nr:hypothetical protein [archaeon]